MQSLSTSNASKQVREASMVLSRKHCEVKRPSFRRIHRKDSQTAAFRSARWSPAAVGRKPQSLRIMAANYDSSDRDRLESAVVDRRREGETLEDAYARRARESAVVEGRLIEIRNKAELQQQFKLAGGKLVVLEISSDSECAMNDTDWEEPEKEWEKTEEEAQLPCMQLKSSLARCARDCPDVTFLH
eukprot:CAMPEP_0197849820 /NCGR_PEP_ID=MMETSP1438-20131217/13305_1 /TAXON_ID=1461541 /ORGANISM="Pterosperma sp., Strain CCMP1384" /LENGTH=186 /DNA_ID=CAMNT_0043462669 /DNA_START=163 /DNA_END=720 /DNA_ORIENTATION=+